MDPTHVDSLLRHLTTVRSRRTALLGLVSGGLGLGLLTEVTAKKRKKKSCPPCTQRKKGKCKSTHPDGTACSGGTCQGGQCVSPPPAPGPPPVAVLSYQCPGPAETVLASSSPGTTRVAQVFPAARSGSLARIDFAILHADTSTGDYLVQLLEAVSGVPTNTVLAQAIVPNGSVPAGSEPTLTASFSGPPLVAGMEYAAALSRPGGSDLGLPYRQGNGNDCLGRGFSQQPSGSGPFLALENGDGTIAFELITNVTVLA